MRRASMAWMVTSGQVSTVRVPSTYTSGLELPVTLSLPRSSRLGQRLYCDQLEMCSCGIAFLTASRTVRPGSADSASPVMITLPAVVGDSGLPPGSVDRSNGRDVAQPSASIGSASRTGTEWKRCMAHLRVGPAAECTMERLTPQRQPLAAFMVLLILRDSMHIPCMVAQLTLDTLGDAATRALGPRLVALLLYGSAARGTHVPKRSDVNTLLICDAVDGALFDALAPVVRAWTKAGHPAPLILTEREWRESAAAFAIEYEDMRDAHRLLAGRDPWPGIQVDREQLRRQLEHELMGKLVRLRQAYAALQEDPKQLARVVVGSSGGFFTMLRAVLRFVGRPVPASPAELVRSAAAVIGFPADGLAPLVQHAVGGPMPRLAKRDPLATAYLAAVARTAEFVNRLT